jgi:hypothetical protein
MTNGHADEIELDESVIVWRDIRQLRKLTPDSDEALDFFESLLERAIGRSIGDLPAGTVAALMRKLNARMSESLSGAGGASAAPSLAASGVAESSTTAT